MHNGIQFVLFGLVAYFAYTVRCIDTFDITLQKFEPFTMTDKDYFDPGTLRVGRKKRNVFVISGNCSIFKNLGEEIMVKYEIFRKNADDNYEKALEGETNICDMISGDNDKFYKSMSEASNLPYPGPCPLPKDEYTFNDFQIDGNGQAQVPPGEAMVKTTFSSGGEELFGYKIYALVEEL